MSLLVVKPDGTIDQRIRIPPGYGPDQRYAVATLNGQPMTGEQLTAEFARGSYYGILPDSVYMPVHNGTPGFSPIVEAWVKRGIPHYGGNPSGDLEPPHESTGYPLGMSGPTKIVPIGAGGAPQDYARTGTAASYAGGGDGGLFGGGEWQEWIGDGLRIAGDLLTPPVAPLPSTQSDATAGLVDDQQNYVNYLELDAKFAMSIEFLDAAAMAIDRAVKAGKRVAPPRKWAPYVRPAINALSSLRTLPVKPVMVADPRRNQQNITAYSVLLTTFARQQDLADSVGMLVGKLTEGGGAQE